MSFNRPDIIARWLCVAPTAPMTSANASTGLIVDLTQDVENALDRHALLEAISTHPARNRLFLRMAPDGAPETIRIFAASRPAGFVLTACAGIADIQERDVHLRVAEAEGGQPEGTFGILAEVGAAPAFFLAHRRLGGASPRLRGVIYNGDAIGAVAGARHRSAPDILVRGVTVLAARDAGVPAYDLMPPTISDDAEIVAFEDAARLDGFDTVIARNDRQAAVVAACRSS